MKRIAIFLSLIMLISLTACQSTTPENITPPTSETVSQSPASIATPVPLDVRTTPELVELDQFVGDWKGVLKTDYFEADNTLHVFNKNGKPDIYMSSETFGIYHMPVTNSEFSDGTLKLAINDEQNRAVFTISVLAPDTLIGTYDQYEKTSEFSLTRISEAPSRAEFVNIGYTERLQQLSEYESYEDDGTVIPYSYELNNREPWLEKIKEYGLDELTKDKADVELMKTLLYWVSDHFKHGNPNGAPGGKDAISVMEFCDTTSGGYTNCRGLSIILADLCRTYGIPAKHITCMPKERYFSDCHVVVLAYSKELNQWVMLDPTYKLVLQDENGAYLDLKMLRDSLINGKSTVSNDGFSYNGGNANITSYREYMTKNTFRFSSATDFYFGAEERSNGNVRNMLIPVGYDEDHAEVTTTSDEAFWKLP